MTRTCPACARTWDGRATWCGVCGASLTGAPTTDDTGRRRRAPRPSRTSVATTVAGLLGAVVVAWLVGGPSGDGADDGAPGAPVVGGIEMPSDGAPDGDADSSATDDGVPMELLATCDGPEGPTGCVRWVQRAGQLPRPGAEAALVTVVGDRLVGVDVETGARRWTAATTPPVSSPLVLGDHTVLLEDGTGVSALDALDGDERWHLPDQHLPVTPPLPLDPEVVVLDDLDGTLTGVRVDDGSVLWAAPADPGGIPVATVPLPSARVLVTTLGSTSVLDALTGEVLWATGASPLAVTDLHVVTLGTGPDGRVLTVHRTDGAALATAALPGEANLREVAITGTRLVLRTTDTLLSLYLSDLSEQWRRPDPGVRLVTTRPLTLAPRGVLDPVTGLGTIALRSTALVAWRTDGSAVVIDERTGEELRTIGERADGLRLSDGFLARRRLWRLDASSLEVYDFPSGALELRIEAPAPPGVVLTSPVVVATSGRVVRLDADATVPSGVQVPR